MRELRAAGQHAMSELFSVGRATIYRAMERSKMVDGERRAKPTTRYAGHLVVCQVGVS